jgi:hypothetical protein
MYIFKSIPSNQVHLLKKKYICIIQFEYRTFNLCSLKWIALHQNRSALGHALTQLEYVFQPNGITMT